MYYLFAHRHRRVVVQLLFWLCLTGLIFWMMGIPSLEMMLVRNLLIYSGIVFLVLINTYVLVPRFFKTRRYSLYSLSVAAMMTVIILLAFPVEQALFEDLQAKLALMRRIMERFPGSVDMPWPFLNNHLPLVMMKIVIYTASVMVSTVFESVQIHLAQERISNQIRSEKLEAEMKFLKGQINPHFLFNVLNNVYTLSLIKSDQTPEVIMKLSEMLRYMLYNANHEVVPLRKEVQYIRHFIDLYQLKTNDPLRVDTHFEFDQPELPIAPMIFIPFVENAFKHSKIEAVGDSWIQIRLTAENGSVHFVIENSVPGSNFTKDRTGGIGLQNVKRRLELQYPNRYTLRIDHQRTFKVELQLLLL